MAIAFDGTSSSGTQGASNNGTYEWTHAITSSSKGALAVGAGLRLSGGTVGTVTWNGTNMTNIRKDAVGNRVISMWYYLNPGVQTGTIKVFNQGTASSSMAAGISLIGIDQSNSLDSNQGTTYAAVTNPTIPTALVANNVWLVSAINSGADVAVLTAGTPGTLTMAGSIIGQDQIAISYGGTYNAVGAGSVQWGMGSSSNAALEYASFKPSPADTNLVQSTGTSNLALGSTLVTFSSNMTAGNLIVVGVTVTNALTLGTVSSITDNQNNTYTLAKSATISEATSVIDEEIWYAKNIIGGIGTVTVNHTVDNAAVFAREYSGFDTLDVTSSANGSNTTPNTGTATTTVASELLIVSTGDDKGAGQTYTPGTVYGDIVGTTATLTGLSMEDNIISATGAQTGTLTFGAAANWVSLFASFYKSSAAGGYKTLLGVGL